MSSPWRLDPQSTQLNGYNAHIILLPHPLKHFLRAVSLLSVVVIALAAHCLSYNDGDHGNTQALVIACCTQVGVLYILITNASEATARFYNRGAVFGLLISGTATWVIVVVYLAANLAGGCIRHDEKCHQLPDIKGKPYYKDMIGEAVLSGVISVLVMVTLVSFSLLYRRAIVERRPMTWRSARSRLIAQTGEPKDNLADQSERSWGVADVGADCPIAEQSEKSWRVPDVERGGTLVEQSPTSRKIDAVERGGPLAQQTERRWGVIGVGPDGALADQSESDWGVATAERNGELQLAGQTKGWLG